VLLFVLLTVGSLFVTLLTAERLQEAALRLPVEAERLTGTISRRVEELVTKHPMLRGVLPDPGTIDRLGDQNRDELMAGLQGRLADAGAWIGEGLMILVLILFVLAESEMLTSKLIRFFAPKPVDARATEAAFKQVVQKIRAYLIARTLLNVGLGVAVTISLRLLHVAFAVELGVITALASFIPYIGQVISGVLVALVALTSLGTVGDMLIVSAIYLALVGLEGYVVMPVVMGRSLDLNGTTVLLACMFWGFVWGMVGLVVAIPITVSLKLICQQAPSLHRWAELMSRDWQTPAPEVPAARSEASPVARPEPSASGTPAATV
jgi:predicted PurR-regulated permease PerM